MKWGYIRLLIFEAVLMLILSINSFILNWLNGYYIAIFLFLITIIFKFLFGFEKDRHRYTKDIIYEILIMLLIFFLLFYLSGLFLSFAKVGNYYTLHNIITFIVPIILTICIKEFLRYQVLTKSEGSKLLNIASCILFIFIDITTTIYYTDFSSKHSIFIFLALTLLPAISTNISCSYIVKKTGYKPVLMYSLIMNLYMYLLPIIPNPNEYITSLIRFLLPVLVAYRIYVFYKKDSEEEEEEVKNSKTGKYITLFISSMVVIFLVYITSGYFKYWAVAIISGSMHPTIDRGDVVIIEKINKDYTRLKEGQVIAYKYNGIIVVHRLVKILKIDDTYYFYSKGDANKDIDNYQIEEDMIIGVVNLKVPYIGYPTVWLNTM